MIFPLMRPQVEIQRVHDMLMDVLSNRKLAEAVLPEGLIAPLMMVADCLCWILHHDIGEHPDSHASHFASVILLLREELEEGGYTSEEPGEYIVE